jgi:anaerobic magnesium-protoporphyrin IX monomethyl ester cyclase
MPQSIVLIFPQCVVKVCGGNNGNAKPEKAISPPLGILYLAAELMDAGFNVRCCDYNAERYSKDHLRQLIADADLVGVSLLSFNREEGYALIRTINHLRPGLPVIAGGADCILHPAPAPGAVLTVVEEAETIIVEIVRAVLQKRSLGTLRGIVFVDDHGVLRRGRPFHYVQSLDFIKFPRRELLRDNKGYTIIGKRSRDITTIITSRGCPKRCRFCAHGALAYRKYRARSVENVVREIEIIARQGYKVLGIVDDNFTADKNRAQGILRGIIDLNIKMTLIVQGRVDAADAGLFRLMKKAGVRGITFGLESGNQQVLDFYDKGVTVSMNEAAVRMADRAGLYTGGIFILGAPMETEADFKRTYDFAASLPLDITSFWGLDYTFGSRLWQDARAKGVLAENEYNVPAGKERGTSRYPTSFIEAYANRCFFRFYCRPGYWLRQLFKLARTRDRYFMTVLAVGIGWLIVKKAAAGLQAIQMKSKRMFLKLAVWQANNSSANTPMVSAAIITGMPEKRGMR